MATQPVQILAKPGKGVDEGFMIVYNEMERIIAIRESKKAQLKAILEKFAHCGWDLLEGPAQQWLNGEGDKAALAAAIAQADAECGSCGCEFDPLYKKALKLL